MMQYECGCFIDPEDDMDATCPIHDMPMQIGTIGYNDLAWAYKELGYRGFFEEDNADERV